MDAFVSRPIGSARAERYRALEALEELLDHDLDESERDDLENRLVHVAENAERDDLKHLAESLLGVVRSEGLALAPVHRSPIWQFIDRLGEMESKYLDRARTRFSLAGGMIALGVTSLWA